MARMNIQPLSVTVDAVTDLSKHMRCLTLTGNQLSKLDSAQEGGYFKLLLPSDTEVPYVRTFTIRKVHPEKSAIDVEFALHDGVAPASNWAEQAVVGSEVLISPPSTGQMLVHDADWHVIAADMTGMPAALVNLEALSSSAKGYVVFEVSSEADIRPLSYRAALELVWVVNPEPGSETSPLVERVRSLPWLAGSVSVWAACEFAAMRQLRAYFRQERGVDRKRVYVSSYWKKGVSEDQHKRIKRADAESFGE